MEYEDSISSMNTTKKCKCSSVGSERLPYKQEIVGSNPTTCTNIKIKND